jgi:putative transposase
MPWKETCIVDERLKFIAAVRDEEGGRGNFTQQCVRFGISRQTGYDLVARYNALGVAALEDRAPKAHHCPHKTSPDVEDLVAEMRKEHPKEGPKKLAVRLAKAHPDVEFPVPSTIGDILKRRSLIRPRRARLRVPAHPSPLEPCSEPNELWCTDFKGHFELGDGTRCHPLTITDAATRYLIRCEGLARETCELARPHFERAFREFGVPERIRSDNGGPFASKAVGGLSPLSVWWIQLGILPERIEPGQPQQNGRHERFHRTLKEQTTEPPAATMADQQRAFDYFAHDYNNERPHESLGQKPPASVYEPSWRPLREPRDPEYGDGFEVRRIRENGRLSIVGKTLYVGRVLAGQPLGLRQTDEDEWDVYYGPLLVGYLLVRDGTPRIEPVA